MAYDQTSLQWFMWNNGERKIIYNTLKLVFRPGKLQILTMTYDDGTLQLSMLNNGKDNIVYDN